MGYSNQFFKALGANTDSRSDLKALAQRTGIPVKRLRFYNETNTVPTGSDLEAIETSEKLSELELMLRMGRLDHRLKNAIQEKAGEILELLTDFHPKRELAPRPTPAFTTSLGELYQSDCFELLQSMESESVDVVFADPPFNLDKLYPSGMNDNLRTENYLEWCERWISECIRVLRHGGSLFLWNLPKWNAYLSDFVSSRMNFKHWIATDIKYGLPISGRLYPSHYSMLYFVKGNKANTFKPDRVPMQTCPSCFTELKDYGGYKHKMNPNGINITDIWTDIPPVRHSKYKRREGANELSIKLLDRVIEMASEPEDVIFDPFGGSGTTFIVSEIKGRRWIGSELGPCDVIVDRFAKINEESSYLKDIRGRLNTLFPTKVKAERIKRGIWTPETIQQPKAKARTSKTERGNFSLNLDLK